MQQGADLGSVDPKEANKSSEKYWTAPKMAFEVIVWAPHLAQFHYFFISFFFRTPPTMTLNLEKVSFTLNGASGEEIDH